MVVDPQRARRATYVAFFVQGMCLAALLTRVPALRRRFGLADGQLAIAMVAVVLIAAVGSLAAGRLAARHGSVSVLRGSAPTVCLALAGIGMAGSLAGAFTALVIFGLVLGMVDSTMNLQGTAVQAVYGRRVMSSFHAAFTLSGILCALVSAATAQADVPLGAFFGAVALLGVTASLATGPALTLRSWVTTPAKTTMVSTVARRPLLLLGLAATCLFTADATLTNWSAEYVQQTLKGSDSSAALAYGAYLAGVLFGRSLGDAALARFGVVRVIRAGALVALAGIALVAAAPVPAFGQVGFAMSGVGLAVVTPQIFTAAAMLDPGGRGGAVAQTNAFTYLGLLLSPPLVALLAEAFSPRVGFAAQLVPVLVVAALAQALDPY
jgi:MFS family permease